MSIILIICNKIIDPILSYFASEALDKGKDFIKNLKEKKFRQKFIDSLEEEILATYGNEPFYDELSKLIVNDNMLSSIYSRCYRIENVDFKTDKQIIDDFVSDKGYNHDEKENIKNAIEYILDKAFAVLNRIEFNDTRTIINHILISRNQLSFKIDEMKNTLCKVLKTVEETNKIAKTTTNDEYKVIPDAQEVPLLSNPILRFLKDNRNKHSVELRITSKEPLFIISLWVKYAGAISRFPTAQQYLAYLSHTGEEGSLDVVAFQIKSIQSNQIYMDYKKDYNGPVCQMVEFEIFSFESLLNIADIQNMDIKITIIPPLDRIIINIENENGEVLIDSLEQGIKREYLPNGDLKVMMIDLRKCKDVSINFTNIFRNGRLVITSINLTNNNDDTVKGRLTYYGLLKKFSMSKNLIYRNSKDGKYYGEGIGITTNKSIDEIEANIELYKKIQKIQDTFFIIFKLPQSFDYEEIEVVRYMYDLIEKGQTTFDGFIIHLEKSNTTTFTKETKMMIHAQFEYVVLFRQRINLQKASITMPLAYVKEETDKEYYFGSEVPSLIIWDEKYGDYDPCEVASKAILEYRENNP